VRIEFGSEFKAPIKLKNLAISDDGHGQGMEGAFKKVN